MVFDPAADELTQLRRARPGRPRVDHAVTVGAQQRKILGRSRLLAPDVQWFHVVALDVPLSALAICLREVELTHFAHEKSAAGQHAADLLAPQGRISLPVSVPAEEVAPLKFALVVIADLARE